MQKEFTVNVPDELWVDSWENALTQTYTYNGPQYFYIGLGDKNNELVVKFGDLESEADPFTAEESADFIYSLTIDADVNPELAYMLYIHDHEDHMFTEITNHDGSIYQQISNPCMKDYFTLEYKSNADDPDVKEAFLDPIYKDTNNILLSTAKTRLSVVQKYDNAYDFDEADQTKIDTFISTINTYIDSIATAYPWKYITVDISEIPKIPASLQLLFNQLPEID